jgi:uncharacterized protein YlzI (FlbEa/FlbD family)
MAFNVNQFRQQMSGDGARPNLFEVQMNVPSYAAAGGGSSNVARKISFMCNSAQLPGSTIGIAPAFYFGREVKLAGNRTYPEWVINIINDEDFVVRNSFERWINGINDPVSNIRSVSAKNVDSGYGVDATVIQYDKTGSAIKKYKFIGMFPVDIAPIEVNWAANDQIEEFAVTLSFQYWTAEERTSSDVIGALSDIFG